MSGSFEKRSDSKVVFGADSAIYMPTLLLVVLIVINGLLGFYSVRSQQHYVQHVGLELVPSLTLTTEVENSMHMTVNAKRELLLVGNDRLRHQRLLADHEKYLNRAEESIANLGAHVGGHGVEELESSEATRGLAELVRRWVASSFRVRELAEKLNKDDEQIRYAMFESMLAFTVLDTRIKEVKHVIVDSFRHETSSGLVIVKFSLYGLLVATLCGLMLSLFSLAYLRRKLNQLVKRLNIHVGRQVFMRQIAEALEMEDSPEGLSNVTGRVLGELCKENRAQLMLTGEDQELTEVAVNSVAGSAHCDVASANSCVAMRRGQISVFEDSSAINTCPYLVGRKDTPVAAVCAPVTYSGSGLGIIHAIYPVDDLPTEDHQEQLKVFSTQLAARLGTVNAFGQSQTLAVTDPLTGLLNRRGLEQRVADMTEQTYTLAMIDIDFFKRLNDSFGHETGDLALQAFSEVLMTSLPEDALACRWGGEEFSVLLPGLSALEAVPCIENVRLRLVELCWFSVNRTRT
ncbi:hypothetical protein AB833_04245 [Chromatiales bacterium (ex Bugula neritina AB1)]|nr:hypothetical protein AB833_04245 [Chromatiales bacterium (ex Bugula neritina AB1)]